MQCILAVLAIWLSLSTVVALPMEKDQLPSLDPKLLPESPLTKLQKQGAPREPRPLPQQPDKERKGAGDKSDPDQASLQRIKAVFDKGRNQPSPSLPRSGALNAESSRTTNVAGRQSKPDPSVNENIPLSSEPSSLTRSAAAAKKNRRLKNSFSGR